MKAIVFDLDGTLVDSLSVSYEAFDHAIETVAGRHISREEIATHFGRAEDAMFVRMLGQEKADPAFTLFRDYLGAHMSRLHLHDGIGDLLETIKSAGVPISIFTGRSWPTTELILKHHKILDRFVTVVTDTHVSQPKPAPEGLLLALSRMKIDPAHALFVGDSAMDILAAYSAGSQGVAATWDGVVKLEMLKATNPHHWAKKPADVWEIWRALTS